MGERIDALEAAGNDTESITEVKQMIKKIDHDMITSEEMGQRERKRTNITIYGLDESGTSFEAQKRNDSEKVKKLFLAMELDINFQILYRAGKKEASKTRPLIVKLENPQMRMGCLDNAKNLKGKDEWKKTTLESDSTKKQREEVKEHEERLRKDADDRNEKRSEQQKTRSCGWSSAAGETDGW